MAKVNDKKFLENKLDYIHFPIFIKLVGIICPLHKELDFNWFSRLNIRKAKVMIMKLLMFKMLVASNTLSEILSCAKLK